MQYFNTCRDVAEIKKMYKALAMRHHPDRGGDLRVMQEINAQYQAALKRANGEVSQGEDGREHTYKYDAKVEQAVIDFIDKLIRSGALQSSVEAYLVGTWVWIMGDTKPVKDTLKELGCKWHSKRTCWFFNVEEKRTFYSNKGFDSLAARYGASKIHGKHNESIAAD